MFFNRNIMRIDEYKEFVKNERASFFKSPYELVYDAFTNLEFDTQTEDFFRTNASEIVLYLREECWNEYLPTERDFISKMLTALINENLYSEDMSPKEIISSFITDCPEHLYQLSLSNTQSRRSRAGKEFEAIIELVLLGAGVPMDSQGNVGKKFFSDKGLGKLVDVVSPGVMEYLIDKNYVALISAKTTLRERWQEVPEEMGRTGAREMFLATLDENVSEEVLDTLYESNIRITTTRDIKNRCYPTNYRVLDFESLINICLQNDNHWNNFNYNDSQLSEKRKMLREQISKHSAHPFVVKRLTEILNKTYQ